MLQQCSNHSGSLAGWRCSGCGAALCADCTGTRRSAGTRLEICSRCGGLCAQLKVHRGELSPFTAESLLQTLRWPLSKGGLVSIAATSALLLLFSLGGGKGRAIAIGVTLAYLFQVVRHTAHGGDDFPGPDDFRGYFEDIVGPSLRLMAALAWIWAPALAWNLWHRAPQPDLADQQRRAITEAMRPGGKGMMVQGMRVVTGPNGTIEVQDRSAPVAQTPAEAAERALPAPPASDSAASEHALSDPAPEPAKPSPLVPAILTLLGLLIAPMSLMASALKTPLRIAANPVVLAGYAAKLGRDYFMLVGFCLLALGAAFVTRVAAHLALGGFLASAVINVSGVFLAFAAFRGIGLLVRARGSEIGYGGEESYLVPALGDAEPRWAPPEQPPEKPPEPKAPIEIAHDERPAGVVFSQLLAQGDQDGMIDLLGRGGKDVPHVMMSANSWMALAQKAWQLKNGKAAAVALKRCLDAEPEGPLAPRAWVLAARVYDEALGDKATSDKLLRELARRFPDSEQGKFAARKLQALEK